MTDHNEEMKSRRFIIKAGALVAATAGVALAGSAQAKVPQKGVQYVAKSVKPNQNCGNCSNFIAPNACKVVDGQIAPTGYCMIWAPKAR